MADFIVERPGLLLGLEDPERKRTWLHGSCSFHDECELRWSTAAQNECRSATDSKSVLAGLALEYSRANCHVSSRSYE